jgi:hypothetical protein
MTVHLDAFKAIYQTVYDKYQLPEYELFDKEFELSDVVGRIKFVPKYTLRFIRRSMIDKCYNVINYLHTFIQPTTHSAISMQEHAHLTESEREIVTQIIKKLMILSRKSTECDLLGDEQTDAMFIKEAFLTWNEVKPQLVSIVQKNLQGWKTEQKKEFDKSSFV